MGFRCLSSGGQFSYSPIASCIMPDEEYSGPLWDKTTCRSGHGYFFYDKHHTPNHVDDAQWLPSLSHADEFAIFNQADIHIIEDAKGNLFGIRRSPDGIVLPLGTELQEVAEFPYTRPPR